ncbi:unnamed protein product, partial [marine sediment metagenome]
DLKTKLKHFVTPHFQHSEKLFQAFIQRKLFYQEFKPPGPIITDKRTFSWNPTPEDLRNAPWVFLDTSWSAQIRLARGYKNFYILFLQNYSLISCAKPAYNEQTSQGITSIDDTSSRKEKQNFSIENILKIGQEKYGYTELADFLNVPNIDLKFIYDSLLIFINKQSIESLEKSYSALTQFMVTEIDRVLTVEQPDLTHLKQLIQRYFFILLRGENATYVTTLLKNWFEPA